MTEPDLPHACVEMRRFVTDPRVPVGYEPRFREYSIALLESDAHQLIHFCPWCGAELPESVRERFFDEMDRLGIDYPDEEPPPRFGTDTWWREQDSGRCRVGNRSDSQRVCRERVCRRARTAQSSYRYESSASSEQPVPD
jgi:hypothetical protein